MDLYQYITPLRKWWWLMVIATIVAGFSSYMVVRNQPPFYQARTTLIIGRTIGDPNPTANQFALDKQLAATYAQIANRETIFESTKLALGLTELPDYEARAVPDSQLIEIAVVDISPARAQAVANELANQLISSSPTNPKPEEIERQRFVEQQLSYFEKQISDNLNEIAVLQEQLGQFNSARQISETQDRINALEIKVATLQGTYTNLLANSQQGATNIISILEPAGLPVRPIGPNKILITALAAISGLILSTGASYLIEYMANTLNTSQDVTHMLPYPIVGSIPDIKNNKSGMYTYEYPFSVVAESFRSLRTSLEFSAVDKPLRTILVASPGVAEGKSTVASNLAFSIAQADKKVILVGADMREPTLHSLLDINNKNGLSDVFRGSVKIEEALQPLANGKVRVLSSGSIPPNPTELLGSSTMNRILEELTNLADVVVIDSSPFIVADAAVLTAKVDGVLIVIRPEYSRKELVAGMKTQIERSGGRVIGVVLNGVSPKNDVYSSYYGRYGSNPDLEKPKSERSSKFGRQNGKSSKPAIVERAKRADQK
jgi:capsular exopolysaccharide synthesis family protein